MYDAARSGRPVRPLRTEAHLPPEAPRRTNDAGRAGPGPGAASPPPKRVGQRANLLVSCGIHELGLGYRFAAAQDSRRTAFIEDLLGIRSVAALQLHHRQ